MKSITIKICTCLVALLTFSLAMAPQDVMAAKKSKEKKHMMQGEASWYGGDFHGKQTASGPIYDMHRPTAAHRTLPFGSVLEVKDTTTDKKTVVIVTDRGPVARDRCVDLSRAAAMELDLGVRGVTPVTMRLLSDTSGNILNDSEAFYVQVLKHAKGTMEQIGPFTNFGDASVMQDILQEKHGKAVIVVASVK